MYTFEADDQARFWGANQAAYQGRKNAIPLLLLTKPFIGNRILDAGAGDGSLIQALKAFKPVATVIGVDIAPKHPDIQQGDLAHLPYDNNSFDTIFCSEVIEHLTPEETGKVLRELRRLLAPDGMLIITTPYAEHLEDQQVCCPRCNLLFHRWGHQQRFQEQDFKELARANELETVLIMPFKYSWVRRFGFMGRGLLVNPWWIARMRKAAGKRHLLMVARCQQ